MSAQPFEQVLAGAHQPVRHIGRFLSICTTYTKFNLTLQLIDTQLSPLHGFLLSIASMSLSLSLQSAAIYLLVIFTFCCVSFIYHLLLLAAFIPPWSGTVFCKKGFICCTFSVSISPFILYTATRVIFLYTPLGMSSACSEHVCGFFLLIESRIFKKN